MIARQFIICYTDFQEFKKAFAFYILSGNPPDNFPDLF